ncbi:hypothetical protein GWI33_003158 [Rhynchophorus ferrugineus]|uniref:WAP domain-containing protein n=1 Tax=Rhynchophorus ferrugineus TaxID=354439 RepID=A0A834MLE1_RHYFE|nr:hypothetical protein GWI33_003158 [Rhynchophorus ferrugineus]
MNVFAMAGRYHLIIGLIFVFIIGVSCRSKNSTLESSSSKCPMLTECPFRAEPCQEDDDCAPDAVCCKSPCGKICTKQLFTGIFTLDN